MQQPRGAGRTCLAGKGVGRVKRLSLHVVRSLTQLRSFPARVGIESRHLGGYRCGVLAQVFFIDYSIVMDNKAHNACRTVPSRIGDPRETADHFAIDKIVVGPTRSVLSLSGENSIEVPMIGRKRPGG